MAHPEKIEVTYKVKATKDDDTSEVTRTLDMSKLSDDDILSYALDSIIILSQAQDRRNALKKDGDGSIKDTAVYVVPKPGQRTIADPMTKLVKLIGKEKADAAVAKHGSAEKVLDIIKSLI